MINLLTSNAIDSFTSPLAKNDARRMIKGVCGLSLDATLAAVCRAAEAGKSAVLTFPTCAI
ncbi:MAG: hypothetical protein ABIT83_26595 [Massilia sp.]